jgi:hypothetical protein
MYKLFIITCFSLGLVACGGNKGENLDPSVINDSNSMQIQEGAADGMPVMTFTKTEHDFGNITLGEKVETKFVFKNTGNANLLITDARGDCGCTVPVYPKEPIAPGKEASIIVSFDSAGKPGENTKRVTVTTNAADANAYLTIRATVLNKN